MEDIGQEAGVGPVPAGRLWLLRTPDGRKVETVTDQILNEAEGEGVEPNANLRMTELARRVIHEVWRSARK